MLRRNVNALPSPDSGNLSSGSGGPKIGSGGASPRLGRQSSRVDSLPRTARNVSEFLSTRVLLVVALLVTAATYMFPADVQNVEHQAYQVEQELEKEMVDWWQQQGGRPPPIPMETDPNHARSKAVATEAMLQQGSKWVDGEKKLKQKLKILAARQAQGQDLGVPVLTRYLGEDIPAWPDKGVDVEEWQKKVTAKYDEMRQEEEDWKKMMQAIMDTEKRG
jgi:hypothetical protein